MVRASWVLNSRQIDGLRFWAAFLQPYSPTSRTRRGRRSGKRTSTLNSISAMYNQLPCLGVVVELQPFPNPPGSLGQSRSKDATRWVFRLSYHPDHRNLRVGFIHQPAHLLGELLHRTSFGPPHAARRLAGQEQVAGSLPTVLVVLPAHPAGPQRRAGSRPATGWRSRQSRPPAAGS